MLSERLLATVIPIISLILLMIPLIMLYKILSRFLFLSNVDPLNKARILPVQELNKPIKAVIPLAEHKDIREDLIFNLNKLECLDLTYHDIEGVYTLILKV
mgnify:CR=1 FL=1